MTAVTRRVVLAAQPPPPDIPVLSAGPDLPGGVGGAGYSWDLPADGPDLPGAVALVAVAGHVVPLPGPRIKRTLLLTVRQGVPAGDVARFEADLIAMPDHISTIRSWELSHVVGPSRWTHAWEQEFADPEGLTGEYLLNPYHWAHVDRWFDPEVPGSIVEPSLAHVMRWSDRPVLGGGV